MALLSPPKRECKIIAKTPAAQVFPKDFFKTGGFFCLSCWESLESINVKIAFVVLKQEGGDGDCGASLATQDGEERGMTRERREKRQAKRGKRQKNGENGGTGERGNGENGKDRDQTGEGGESEEGKELGKEDEEADGDGGEDEEEDGSGGYVFGGFDEGMPIWRDTIADFLNGGVEAFGHEDATDAKDDCAPFPGGDAEDDACGNDTDGGGKMDLGVALVAEEGCYALEGETKGFIELHNLI